MTRYTALIDGTVGAYGVVFPDLPGCAAMGATVEEALFNAADAMRDWVSVTVENGGKVPPPRPLDKVRLVTEVVEALAEGSSLASVALVRETGKPVKANLSLDAGVLAAIDAEAARRNLTRSAFVEMMAKRSLAELA